MLQQEIDHALYVHRLWMQRLRRSIRRPALSELDEISRAERCAVHHLLQKASKPIKLSAVYDQVLRAHQAFHDAAAATMELIRASDVDRALEQLRSGGPTREASDRLCNLLAQWRDAVATESRS